MQRRTDTDLLSSLHGRSAEQRAAMLDEYQREVELSRRWRTVRGE